MGNAIVRVDGNFVSVWCSRDNHEEIECGSRNEAEALVEQKIAELHAAGFYCAQIETLGTDQTNPPPVTPLVRPTMRAWSDVLPATACDAVDQAVARVTEFHELFPHANAVLELIEAGDTERIREFGLESLAKWNSARWRSKALVDAATCRNSFDYFAKRYGSLTWTLQSCWLEPKHVRTFNSNNVHGGGNCVLAIEASDTYGALTELAKEVGKPGVEKLVVFDGGWRFAFDTAHEENGEHPIVRFSSYSPSLFSGGPVVPFGYWLLEQVKSIASKETLLDWLALVNGPN